MKQLIKYVLSTLAELGQSEQLILLTVGNNSNLGMITGVFKQGDITLPNKRVKLTGTPLEVIISTKQTKNYPGTLIDSLPFPSYKKTHHDFECLCLPLINEKNQVISIAILEQKTGTNLFNFRLKTLDMLRSIIGMSIDISIENRRLYQIATVDTATGLHTKHYFETRLQEELKRIGRHGGVISLLLIDIDHFTLINENYGYQQANKVIKEISQLLDQSVRRAIDLPCRYGTKQFMILLPNTDVDGAYVLAERIRQRCEEHTFAMIKEQPLKVTISVGVAHNVDIDHSQKVEGKKHQSLSKEELVYRTDLMLNAAKQAGRNKVMVWW